jgi:hypothetical protein
MLAIKRDEGVFGHTAKLADEACELIANFDCALDQDICVYVENQSALVTLINKTGESKL